MRIGIDGRELEAGRMTGIGRYLSNFLAHATRARPGHRFFLYGNQETASIVTAPNLRVRILPERLPLWWDQSTLPRAMAEDRVDVALSPYPKIPLRAPCPCVSTIHDVTFLKIPENSGWGRAFLNPLARHWYRLLARRADHIITDSEHSRRDILDFLGPVAGKLTVVPIAIRPEFKPTSDRARALGVVRKYGIQAPYLLYVGNFKPHKNVRRLLEAFQQARDASHPELRLVLAGDDEGNRPALERRARQLRGSPVVFTGFVEERDLPYLYAAAEAFILPSLYEGFGLPALEAMACGTPVIVSNVTSLPEIVGDAATLVDPRDTEEMGRAISGLLADPAVRQALVRRGLARSRRFTLESTAGKVLQVLEEVGRRGPATAAGMRHRPVTQGQ